MTISRILITIAILVSSGVFLWKLQHRKTIYETAKETSTLRPGPIRHNEIDPKLQERIRNFQSVFSEVYPISFREWLDGFQRDSNPEDEVVIWEQMASVYSKFLNSNNLTAAARKEAFGVLLVRSSNSDEDSIISSLKVISEDQGRALLALYEADAKPVTYEVTPPKK